MSADPAVGQVPGGEGPQDPRRLAPRQRGLLNNDEIAPLKIRLDETAVDVEVAQTNDAKA